MLKNRSLPTIETLCDAADQAGIGRGKMMECIRAWRPDGILFRRWFDSLERGEPDFGIYADDGYLGEAWACWKDYSRKYILQLPKATKTLPRGLAAELGDFGLVVDVGCGLGLSTAALAVLYGGARIVGTNVPGSSQWVIAERLSRSYGFELTGDPAGLGGGARALLFASEYFEHFFDPLEELDRCLRGVEPAAVICANAFTATAPGHFFKYSAYGVPVSGKEIGKHFRELMALRGYRVLKTGFWNNRPAVWVKGGGRYGV